ncbi:hypothetical protein MtrunA17_Chr1g0202681 [Medicago truncatula]|uniref:Transmembrane protein n=1 Tax=Medicago truncatula TaxID=3880 RepID=A0A396K161_MEDTR|nr:hypothetical protein MtrunA17_Chr1g0202681 [Medicago truncatula]
MQSDGFRNCSTLFIKSLLLFFLFLFLFFQFRYDGSRSSQSLFQPSLFLFSLFETIQLIFHLLLLCLSRMLLPFITCHVIH